MSKIYLDLKICDLREECKKRNLETSGLKVHLVERLTKYDKTLENSTKETEKKSPERKVDSNEINEIKYDQSFTEEKSAKVSSTTEIKKSSTAKIKSLVENAYFEPEKWESCTDVQLDFYNSDMNIVIDCHGTRAQSLSESGFEYMFAGVKANYGINSGKAFYEVKVVKKVNVHLEGDVGDANVIRVGWSMNHTSLCLGEEELSFAYDGSGQRSTGGVAIDYGVAVNENDVIGCFLEFVDDGFVISFSVNGSDQGVSFKTTISELTEQFLLPHVYVRNMIVEVNFGVDKSATFQPMVSLQEIPNVEDVTWPLLGKVELAQRIRGPLPPATKAECEVLMMCGLPSCGKTTWVDNNIKNHPNKFYNVLSTNVVLEKMKVMALRKKCSGSRWDGFIQNATQCLTKLMEIAVSRRRNFILDQTNVYPTAQRRRMRTFEEFIRKAIIIVPTDDEYQRRMKQVITEEGKDVPESAVLQMKENFVIPEEKSDLFNEIIFVELQRTEAEELVKRYNDEVRSKRKTDEHGNKRSEREDVVKSSSSSSRKTEVDSSIQSASKKSRWNEEYSDEKTSRSKDYGNKSSSSTHSTRKTDYKGGFCLARDSDGDMDKGGRGSHRTEDKHSARERSRSKERRGDDRHGRKDSRDQSDNRHGRDRVDERRGRSRERGEEHQRGSNFGQDRDRDRPGKTGYNDRRQGGNTLESEYSNSGQRFTKSSITTYEPVERGSRFPTGERGGRHTDVRGTQPGQFGGHQKYTEFDPYVTAPGGQFKEEVFGGYKSSERGSLQGMKAPGGSGQVSNRGTRWGGAIDGSTTQPDNLYGPSSSSQLVDPYDADDTSLAYEAYFDNKPSSDTTNNRADRGGGVGGEGVKFNQPFSVKPGQGYYNKPQEDTSRFTQPYNSKVPPPADNQRIQNNPASYFNKVDDTPKFGQPYPSKSGTNFSNRTEESIKFDNPYVSKTGSYSTKTDNTTKFDNPYAQPFANKPSLVAAGYTNKADNIPKFGQPCQPSKAPSSSGSSTPKLDNAYTQKGGHKVCEVTGKVGGQMGPLAGSYDRTNQSMKHNINNVYEEYGEPNEYYNDYNEQGGGGGGNDGGDDNDNTSAHIPTNQSSLSYKTELNDFYNSLPIGSFRAPMSSAATVTVAYESSIASQLTSLRTGTYNPALTAPTNTVVSEPYNVQSSGSYNSAVRGALSNTPSRASYNNTSRATYNNNNNRSSDLYDSPIKGTYNDPSSGTYNTQTRGTYSAPSRGGVNASSRGVSYDSQSMEAYNNAASGPFKTPLSAVGHNNVLGAAYKTPTSETHMTAPSSTYNTPAQSGGGYYTPYTTPPSGPYKTPSSGAYTPPTTGTYMTPSSGPYNSAGGGGYYTPTSSAYHTPPSGVGAQYSAPHSAQYNEQSYNAPSGAAPYKALPGATHSAQSYNAPPSAPYNTQSYNAPPSAPSTAPHNAPSSAPYNAPSTAPHNAQSYNAPSSAPYKVQPRPGYGMAEGYTAQPSAASRGGYNTPSNVLVKGAQSECYGQAPSSGMNTRVPLSSSTSASYNNSAYGPYTNTASGSYGNQTMGTGNIPKSTSFANAGNNAYSSYTNPYSNCYENTGSDGSYDYYGHDSSNTKSGTASTDKSLSASSAPPSNTKPSVYGDYSQYYGQ